jgi:hypothetical protein
MQILTSLKIGTSIGVNQNRRSVLNDLEVDRSAALTRSKSSSHLQRLDDD